MELSCELMEACVLYHDCEFSATSFLHALFGMMHVPWAFSYHRCHGGWQGGSKFSSGGVTVGGATLALN